MTSRVPLLNFVIPFLILYPIPNNAFGGNQGKVLLSVIIFWGVYCANLKILKCRIMKTKVLLILLGIFMSFSRIEQSFFTPILCKTEIIASIDSNGFFQTKSGDIHDTVKITEIQESKLQWRGKDVIVKDQYGLLNKSWILSEKLTVKGVIYSNELSLPTFAINKVIEDKSQGSLKKIIENKDTLIKKFWISSKASSNTKSFIIAFTTGSKGYIDDATKNTYICAGVMHLFAVSGLHFGILYVILRFAVRIISINKLFTTLFIISVLFLYLIFIGFTYSAQRAFLMILIWEISNIFFKRKCAICALSFSFVITSLLNPESLFQLGFQLSFTIVLLIIWFSRNNFLISENKSFFAYFSGLVKCSFAAFFGSFFILLGSFGQIVPISIISNIILIPFAFLIMVIFLIYLLEFYLLNFDLYFIVNFVYYLINELLSFLNDFPLSYFSFDIEVNGYIYIFLPILVITIFNKNWGFFLKFTFTSIVSLSSIFYAVCF